MLHLLLTFFNYQKRRIASFLYRILSKSDHPADMLSDLCFHLLFD